MARILKDYDERKSEFLAAAQQLFFEKGYETTSVNTIIDKVGVSKGTFYHYYKSKEDLLDDLVESHTNQHLEAWKRIIEDDGLNALQKLNVIFESSSNLKSANKELVKMMFEALYRDENIIMRYKLNKRRIEAATVELTKIIEQGLEEGLFNTRFPRDSMELVLTLGANLGDELAGFILAADQDPQSLIGKMMEKFEAYETAMERILGAEEGSIKIVKREFLEEYFGVEGVI